MSLIYNKEITVQKNVDVFVAGGGPSGVAAAVAASKCGCRVFLAESSGSFGGMGTNGLVPMFRRIARKGMSGLAGRGTRRCFAVLPHITSM